MKKIMVRYRVKAEKAGENKRLVRTVFEELEAQQPAGIRYASFVLPDGVSFLHIASIETDDGSNPLAMSGAFRAFQKDIRDRCEESPVAVELEELGEYRIFNS